MKKEEKQKILEYSKYTAFFVATLFVLFYQIWGRKLLAVFALTLYTVGFFIFMFIELERSLYIIQKIKEETDIEKQRDLKKKNIEAVIKYSISGAFAVFTLVVLILF